MSLDPSRDSMVLEINGFHKYDEVIHPKNKYKRSSFSLSGRSKLVLLLSIPAVFILFYLSLYAKFLLQ